MGSTTHFVGAIHESPVQRVLNPMGGGRIVMRPYDFVSVTNYHVGADDHIGPRANAVRPYIP